ncbi:MAG: sigma-70 family RNA polymerase sigma factor [Verrucomicrobia bacterium]|nr:sigma-70 family RNA polymerase sigma factor [Verrucomicrobiota bacterium]
MLLVASGDYGAFRRLVERHQGLVIATVARMIGISDAEDIAQQVFLNVWKSAPRWRPEARFTTWLLIIAKRLVFNESRRRTRTRLIPQSRDPDEERADHPDGTPGPDQQILERELHRAIEQALASLPEKERLALILRRYENMPYEEIATVLSLSLPAVKSLLFRARNTLKEKLGPYLEG